MATACSDCEAGYACPNTYSPPSLCPPGYYSLGNATSCTICPAGSHCPTPDVAPVACSAGYYSFAGWSMCLICPIGYKCPNKNTVPELISTNEFTLVGSDSNTPSTCTAGQARTSGGACQDCPSGYTSYGGNDIRCVPCPPGWECNDNSTAPTKCENNEHSYWMTTTCQTCNEAGQQCMFRERDYFQPCPHGTYMPTSNTNSLMCLPCPAGSSCLQKGGETGCSTGEYSLEGEIHCHQCPSGASCDLFSYTLCTLGQFSPYGNNTCYNCEAGYYCPDIYQHEKKCPPGTYQDATGQTYCKTCAEGYYTDRYGQTSCTQCPAGSYCQYSDRTPIVCPFGTYSAVGSLT